MSGLTCGEVIWRLRRLHHSGIRVLGPEGLYRMVSVRTELPLSENAHSPAKGWLSQGINVDPPTVPITPPYVTLSWFVSSCLNQGILQVQGRPEEPHPFAGYRGIGGAPRLGFCQCTKTFVQSALCLLGNCHYFCRDHTLPFQKCCTAPWGIGIFPCDRDQSFPNMPISRLGDPTPPGVFSRTVFAGDQPQIAHQRARMSKPTEIAQLCHQRDTRSPD